LRSAAAHLPALMLFGALTALFTWPLPAILTSGVLGRESGDNLAVVWNFWWVRTALAGDGLSIFWTPYLFAPIGASLITHTLTPLLTVSGALVPWEADPVLLYNAALIAAVFLNFIAAYAAAYSITRDRLSAIFAAVAFGGAPFLLARLYGHLNLLSAWGLPLLLLATIRYQRQPAITRAIALAVTIGIVAYTDYYYLIFGLLLVALHLSLSFGRVRVQARPLTPRHRRILNVVIALIAVVSAAIAWIYGTGGADTTIAGIRLRMTDTFNPRVALGFLLTGALIIWKGPVLTFAVRPDPPDRKVWRLLPVAASAVALLLSPILVSALSLWLSGDYATQDYFWRSAPPGIDVGTLVLGNPLGLITGRWTAAALERLEINPMEGTAWLGLVPLALLIVAIRRLRSRSDVQVYLWIGGLFLIWSLGPYLRVLGANTAFMLPQTFLRFLPMLGNARIPGRAIVVVQLMIAILGAIALASFRGSPRGTAIAVVAILVLTLDYWPRPHPSRPLERSSLYASVRHMPLGIVLEVPLGIADGIAARGRFDYRGLYYQTLHEHPQMGGAVSRMSPRTRKAFESDPIVGPLLDLSEGITPPFDAGSQPPCRNSLACGVGYVVINETAASDALQAFVMKSFRLRPLTHEAGHTLYQVDNMAACECAGRVD
jgi:hypothetical protein